MLMFSSHHYPIVINRTARNMNVFPNTFGSDIASSSTGFLANSGVLPVVYIVGGILLAFFVMEIIISSLRKPTTPPIS